jgi:hypothetical protein
VVDDTDVFVSGEGNAGTTLTDGVTPIDFTETSDTTGSWDGSTFTAPLTGKYHFAGGINYNAVTTRFVSFYKSTDGGSSYTHYMHGADYSDGSTLGRFQGILDLNAGDKIQIRINNGNGGLTNNPTYHNIRIIRLKDSLKAFIGNLTPKEFVQTPGSTKPVMYSATITSACAQSSDVGSFIASCSEVSTGIYELTPESSKFSDLNCTVSAINTNENITCRMHAKPSTSLIKYNCRNHATPANVSTDAMIVCHGVQ